MRINHVILTGCYVTRQDIYDLCEKFHKTYRILPEHIKMSYKDLASFISVFEARTIPLEKGKHYGLFIAVPGGVVELLISDEDSMDNGRVMFAESLFADREFERHILNTDQ